MNQKGLPHTAPHDNRPAKDITRHIEGMPLTVLDLPRTRKAFDYNRMLGALAAGDSDSEPVHGVNDTSRTEDSEAR